MTIYVVQHNYIINMQPRYVLHFTKLLLNDTWSQKVSYCLYNLGYVWNLLYVSLWVSCMFFCPLPIRLLWKKHLFKQSFNWTTET